MCRATGSSKALTKVRFLRKADANWYYPSKAPVAQLDRAPDFESGGQGFESLPARQLNYYPALLFPLEVTDGAVPVCSWFANFVRSEFSKLKMACSASPLVRAR